MSQRINKIKTCDNPACGMEITMQIEPPLYGNNPFVGWVTTSDSLHFCSNECACHHFAEKSGLAIAEEG